MAEYLSKLLIAIKADDAREAAIDGEEVDLFNCNTEAVRKNIGIAASIASMMLSRFPGQWNLELAPREIKSANGELFEAAYALIHNDQRDLFEEDDLHRPADAIARFDSYINRGWELLGKVAQYSTHRLRNTTSPAESEWEEDVVELYQEICAKYARSSGGYITVYANDLESDITIYIREKPKPKVLPNEVVIEGVVGDPIKTEEFLWRFNQAGGRKVELECEFEHHRYLEVSRISATPLAIRVLPFDDEVNFKRARLLSTDWIESPTARLDHVMDELREVCPTAEGC